MAKPRLVRPEAPTSNPSRPVPNASILVGRGFPSRIGFYECCVPRDADACAAIFSPGVSTRMTVLKSQA
jgi:hypothetical protein